MTLLAFSLLSGAVFARNEADKNKTHNDFATTSSGEEDTFDNINHTGLEKFNSVTFTQPAAGATCTVTADIIMVGYEDEEVEPVFEAHLIYSVNSGPETSVSMVKKITNGDVWTAEIPAQAPGTNVRFHIRATDNFGNTTSGAEPSAGRIAEAVPDMDNSSDLVEDDLDILEFAAGYDAEHIYVRFSVQGKISGGKLDIPYINLYGIKLSNPDIEANEGLVVGNMWMIIPQLSLTPERIFQRPLERIRKFVSGYNKYDPQKEIDKITSTGMIAFNIGKAMGEYDNWGKSLLLDAEPDGKIKGGEFAGYINRSIIGNNPSGLIRLILMTAGNYDLDHLRVPDLRNCSHYLNLYLSDYSYTVE